MGSADDPLPPGMGEMWRDASDRRRERIWCRGGLSLLALPLSKIPGTDPCWDSGAAAHHNRSRRLPPLVQRKHYTHIHIRGKLSCESYQDPTQKENGKRIFPPTHTPSPPLTCWCWYTGNLFSPWHHRGEKMSADESLPCWDLCSSAQHIALVWGRLGERGCHRGNFLTFPADGPEFSAQEFIPLSRRSFGKTLLRF